MIQARFAFTSALCAACLVLASAPALAEMVQARLVGYNEVPAMSTAGTGRFKAKIDEAAGSVYWELEYSGMQADVTQSHIHFGQRHTSGGITIWLCQSSANPAPAAVAALTHPCATRSASLNGTITAANVLASTIAAQQLPAGALDQVIRAIPAGSTYVNVHTGASPGGEIRGQIRKSDDDEHGKDKGKGKD